MKSKNIHLLPTDKPSKLLKNIQYNTFWLSTEFLHREVKRGVEELEYQNISITSDEEIKDGEWCLLNNRLVVRYFKPPVESKSFKKIILTTDKDLIKNGVQAIPDEFLEWFINNQSCEWVEVRKECCGQCDERLCEVYDRGIGWNKNNTFYEIIIPKEEPKQESLSWDELIREAGGEEQLMKILKLPHIAPLVREAMKNECKK